VVGWISFICLTSGLWIGGEVSEMVHFMGGFGAIFRAIILSLPFAVLCLHYLETVYFVCQCCGLRIKKRMENGAFLSIVRVSVREYIFLIIRIGEKVKGNVGFFFSSSQCGFISLAALLSVRWWMGKSKM
jgi:hypothetical protein